MVKILLKNHSICIDKTKSIVNDIKIIFKNYLVWVKVTVQYLSIYYATGIILCLKRSKTKDTAKMEVSFFLFNKKYSVTGKNK